MAPAFAMLSTFPPTQCGIATFSASLAAALTTIGERTAIVSIVDDATPVQPTAVVHRWARGESGGARRAAAVLNRHSVVVIQHEFGIFGGPDGADVLDVLAELTAPAITVMHTVVARPTPDQRQIVNVLLARSDRVVVMTWAARDRLIDLYQGEPTRIIVIPHGAPDMREFVRPRRVPVPRARPVLLTWGLLGQGKGIEWAIEAMALLKGMRRLPRYLVVGQTHPKVAAREGEQYREHLQQLVRQWGLEDTVSFDARYHDTKELFRIANAADMVVLPYDSVDQVTSGVLVEAVAAGKPVISTGFPHAVELLGRGAGIIVDRQDPVAIADAVRRMVTHPRVLRRMAGEARRLAPELHWEAVAQRYRDLALEIVATPRRVGVGV